MYNPCIVDSLHFFPLVFTRWIEIVYYPLWHSPRVRVIYRELSHLFLSPVSTLPRVMYLFFPWESHIPELHI